MPAGYELLSALRVNQIMQGLQDARTIPQQLVWSQRIPDVPAVDGEIMGRFIGQIQIADLIADDAKAAVYQSDRITVEAVNIPNLKVGQMLSQEMLNQLDTINAGNTRDMGIFSNYQNRVMANIRVGIQQRKEALFIAMLTDGFSYNRLGIKMTNVTWGMPSDLKITTAVDWSTSATATPITDLLTAKRVAQVRYGTVFNRVSMSTSAFDYMTKTTEFTTRARFLLYPGQPDAVIPLQNYGYMKNLAGSILGLEVELYDARYWSQATDGTITSAPFLPITQVILTDSGNDGNANVYDFANGIVTESRVASLVGGGMLGGGIGGPQFGPIGYATAPVDLNPPNITYWGVARGFPRKKLLQSSACLTVGAFANDISTAIPNL